MYRKNLLNLNNNKFYPNLFRRFSEATFLREKLIKLSLLNVDKYGWTDSSIKTAANELGYSNNLAALLPKGPIELIHYTMDSWNTKLRHDLQEIKASSLSQDEKFQKALKLRLSYELPLINTWPQAIRLGMNPQNIKPTIDRLLIMTDEICSVLEDKPSSSSIVRRYLIIKIFLLGELHLISDKSFNNESTWDFVNRVYNFNFGIFSTLSKFAMLSSAVLSMIKYSLVAFAPYDFSQVDEILKLQQEEKERTEDFVTKLHNKL